MSTSSIYYTATDVPMRNESWHAEQAFKSYKLGGEIWFSCVLYIVTACVGFVGLFAIDSSDCPNIVLEIVVKIYFASMCMLGIGYLAFVAKRLMYRSITANQAVVRVICTGLILLNQMMRIGVFNSHHQMEFSHT